jgi:hypothetical protein
MGRQKTSHLLEVKLDFIIFSSMCKMESKSRIFHSRGSWNLSLLSTGRVLVQLRCNSSPPWCNSSAMVKQHLFSCLDLSKKNVEHLGIIKCSFIFKVNLVRKEFTSCYNFFVRLHVFGPCIGVTVFSLV